MAATARFPVKLTPRAREVLTRATEEAARVGATDFVGVEHVFLAIINEGQNVPAQVLSRLGLTEKIRTELLRVLASLEYRTPTRRIRRNHQ